MNHDTETCNAVSDRFRGLNPGALSADEKQSVIRLALSVLSQRHRPGRRLTSPDRTREYLRLKLGGRQREVFGALYLDAQHRILQYAELFEGTIDGAAVYPRVVVQRALEANAAAVVLFHNHPSGVAEPSAADRAITDRLRDSLALIDVRVLDHLVVCAGDVVSFAERGLV